MSEAALRHRLDAERDLRWFFAAGRGDLGVRALDYTEPDHDDAGDQSTSHLRRTHVAKKLRAMAAEDVEILSLAYTPRTWPATIASWHERAGVAAWLLAGAGAALTVDDAVNALESMQRDPDQRGDLATLRARATHRLDQAVRAYDADASAAHDVKPLWSVVELAARLGITTRTVMRWLQAEGVPVAKIGNENHVWLSELFAHVPEFWESERIARLISDAD